MGWLLFAKADILSVFFLGSCMPPLSEAQLPPRISHGRRNLPYLLLKDMTPLPSSTKSTISSLLFSLHIATSIEFSYLQLFIQGYLKVILVCFALMARAVKFLSLSLSLFFTPLDFLWVKWNIFSGSLNEQISIFCIYLHKFFIYTVLNSENFVSYICRISTLLLIN